MEKKISISQIKEVAQEAYNEVKGSTGGKNADYIPYLANIDSKLFGLSICLMNGQTINIGDTDYRFGIESVSKVHTAILILRQYGAQKVLDMIGADATGLPFNSIIAILLVAFLVVPFAFSNYTFQAVLIPFLIMSLGAIGLNILVGYCGQISLGTGR